MGETPVLFLVFNRPETSLRVFSRIKKAKPVSLYIAADGPRDHISGEREVCNSLRVQLLKSIDWECSVKTLFRERNLGCRQAVSSALSWFFQQEKYGIILEDDCLPDLSFFNYAEVMLKRYSEDERVMLVSGTNYLMGKDFPERDYFFSRYFAIWGWATWKRAWEKYDIEMSDWENFKSSGALRYVVGYDEIADFYRSTLDVAYRKEIDTWDLQWVYTCLVNNGLAVVPVNNLVSNIGATGTHTGDNDSPYINMPSKSFPMKNVKIEENVYPNSECDLLCFKNIGVEVAKNRKKNETFNQSLKRMCKKYFWGL